MKGKKGLGKICHSTQLPILPKFGVGNARVFELSNSLCDTLFQICPPPRYCSGSYQVCEENDYSGKQDDRMLCSAPDLCNIRITIHTEPDQMMKNDLSIDGSSAEHDFTELVIAVSGFRQYSNFPDVRTIQRKARTICGNVIFILRLSTADLGRGYHGDVGTELRDKFFFFFLCVDIYAVVGVDDVFLVTEITLVVLRRWIYFIGLLYTAIKKPSIDIDQVRILNNGCDEIRKKLFD